MVFWVDICIWHIHILPNLYKDIFTSQAIHIYEEELYWKTYKCHFRFMTTTTPRRLKRRVPRIRTTTAHIPVLIMETRIITKDIREANIMTIIMATAIMDTTILTTSTITESIPTSENKKYQSIRLVYVIRISKVLQCPFRFHRPFQITITSLTSADKAWDMHGHSFIGLDESHDQYRSSTINHLCWYQPTLMFDVPLKCSQSITSPSSFSGRYHLQTAAERKFSFSQ